MISSCSKGSQGEKPKYRDVTEAVYSTVLVKPRNSYNVYPKVGGIIDELFIEEGDEVKKGDVLLTISNSTSSVNVENARLKYEIAKETYSGESAMLNEMQEQIETAKVKLESDSINYERQKRLWNQNVGSRMEYDSRKLAYEISRSELNRLTTLYARNQKELGRQVEIARNTVRLNQLNEEEFKLKSKMDGVVYSIAREEGESVSAQNTVAIIGSKNDFILSMLVDEADISRIYKGQNVVVALDAYPDQTFDAKIIKIYPEKDERSLTFEVEADFISRPDRLLKGLSGEANIVISERKNVLTLPSQLITEDGKVNTSEGLTNVETGIKSLEFTEIINGIDSSTIVKIPE